MTSLGRAAEELLKAFFNLNDLTIMFAESGIRIQMELELPALVDELLDQI